MANPYESRPGRTDTTGTNPACAPAGLRTGTPDAAGAGMASDSSAQRVATDSTSVAVNNGVYRNCSNSSTSSQPRRSVSPSLSAPFDSTQPLGAAVSEIVSAAPQPLPPSYQRQQPLPSSAVPTSPSVVPFGLSNNHSSARCSQPFATAQQQRGNCSSASRMSTAASQASSPERPMPPSSIEYHQSSSLVDSARGSDVDGEQRSSSMTSSSQSTAGRPSILLPPSQQQHPPSHHAHVSLQQSLSAAPANYMRPMPPHQQLPPSHLQQQQPPHWPSLSMAAATERSTGAAPSGATAVVPPLGGLHAAAAAVQNWQRQPPLSTGSANGGIRAQSVSASSQSAAAGLLSGSLPPDSPPIHTDVQHVMRSLVKNLKYPKQVVADALRVFPSIKSEISDSMSAANATSTSSNLMPSGIAFPQNSAAASSSGPPQSSSLPGASSATASSASEPLQLPQQSATIRPSQPAATTPLGSPPATTTSLSTSTPPLRSISASAVSSLGERVVDAYIRSTAAAQSSRHVIDNQRPSSAGVPPMTITSTPPAVPTVAQLNVPPSCASGNQPPSGTSPQSILAALSLAIKPHIAQHMQRQAAAGTPNSMPQQVIQPTPLPPAPQQQQQQQPQHAALLSQLVFLLSNPTLASSSQQQHQQQALVNAVAALTRQHQASNSGGNHTTGGGQAAHNALLPYLSAAVLNAQSNSQHTTSQQLARQVAIAGGQMYPPTPNSAGAVSTSSPTSTSVVPSVPPTPSSISQPQGALTESAHSAAAILARLSAAAAPSVSTANSTASYQQHLASTFLHQNVKPSSISLPQQQQVDNSLQLVPSSSALPLSAIASTSAPSSATSSMAVVRPLGIAAASAGEVSAASLSGAVPQSSAQQQPQVPIRQLPPLLSSLSSISAAAQQNPNFAAAAAAAAAAVAALSNSPHSATPSGSCNSFSGAAAASSPQISALWRQALQLYHHNQQSQGSTAPLPSVPPSLLPTASALAAGTTHMAPPSFAALNRPGQTSASTPALSTQQQGIAAIQQQLQRGMAAAAAAAAAAGPQTTPYGRGAATGFTPLPQSSRGGDGVWSGNTHSAAHFQHPSAAGGVVGMFSQSPTVATAAAHPQQQSFVLSQSGHQQQSHAAPPQPNSVSLDSWRQNLLCALAYGARLQASVQNSNLAESLPKLLARMARESSSASGPAFDAVLSGAFRAVLEDQKSTAAGAQQPAGDDMKTTQSKNGFTVWNGDTFLGRILERGGDMHRTETVSQHRRSRTSKRKWYDRIFDATAAADGDHEFMDDTSSEAAWRQHGKLDGHRSSERRRIAVRRPRVRSDAENEASDLEELFDMESSDEEADDKVSAAVEALQTSGAALLRRGDRSSILMADDSVSAAVESKSETRPAKRARLMASNAGEEVEDAGGMYKDSKDRGAEGGMAEGLRSGSVGRSDAVREGLTSCSKSTTRSFRDMRSAVGDFAALTDFSTVSEQLTYCFHPRPLDPVLQELLRIKWCIKSSLTEPISESAYKAITNYRPVRVGRGGADDLSPYFLSPYGASGAGDGNMPWATTARRRGAASGASGGMGHTGGRSSNRYGMSASTGGWMMSANGSGTGVGYGGEDSSGITTVLCPSAFDSMTADDLIDTGSGGGGSGRAMGVGGGGSDSERPFDMVKRHTGWHPYVWFLMCRRPEMYSLGVEAGLVAKIAGEEWGELQRQTDVLQFLKRVVEFVNEHPVPRTSDKKAMKAYKQLAAKNVRTPLSGRTTAAMTAVVGSTNPTAASTVEEAARRFQAAEAAEAAAAAAAAVEDTESRRGGTAAQRRSSAMIGGGVTCGTKVPLTTSQAASLSYHLPSTTRSGAKWGSGVNTPPPIAVVPESVPTGAVHSGVPSLGDSSGGVPSASAIFYLKHEVDGVGPPASELQSAHREYLRPALGGVSPVGTESPLPERVPTSATALRLGAVAGRVAEGVNDVSQDDSVCRSGESRPSPDLGVNEPPAGCGGIAAIADSVACVSVSALKQEGRN